MRLLAAHYPERCLWASNWPHPHTKPEPSISALLDWALGCVAHESPRREMLVDNPAELYGF